MGSSVLEVSEHIKNKIYNIRGLEVMLDGDLAELYGVELKRLNEQVSRNIDRFPLEFRFQLTQDEHQILRSQFATLRLSEENTHGKHTKYLPYVFTEQGVAMLSAVLKSKTAIKMSIQIINTFVNMRKFLSKNSELFQRMDLLEKRQITNEIESDSKFTQLFDALESKDLTPNQGVFFDGEVFDAYIFSSNLIKKAEKSIILIDNYVDETTLTHLSIARDNVKITLLSKTISKKLQLDIDKYNEQYKNLQAIKFNSSHDRFLIIDHTEIYHIGASLKDLGKKWFAFSLLEEDSFALMAKVKEIVKNGK